MNIWIPGVATPALLCCLLWPACGATLRWASSSQRIYVTGPGNVTLTDIKSGLPNAPLILVDPTNHVWYLGAHLFVENGARLNLYGPAIGGDVAELRLKSDNTLAPNAFVEIQADWGWLDIRHTRLTSWDSAVNGPDTETATFRRAFVRVRSKLDPDGVTAHESRMDIINSEVCYLGSKNTEAYGLTWKVVDTSAVYLPPGSTNSLFDVVNVYGDILNSHIHHNYFGVYTYGHQGGRWATNEVAYNIQYGFDPHDDSDYLVIESNNVHHNGWHGIIASKRCDHGVMRNNVSWNNGTDLTNFRGHGIMLHRSSNDWLIEGNQCRGNADTGISVFACDRTLIRNNLCLSNSNAGIRLNVGSANNLIEGNVIGASHQYGLYLFEGDDPPEPSADGGPGSARCYGNLFTNNIVSDCTSDYIKVNGADRNLFLANTFNGSSPTLRFQNGTNNLLIGNLLPSDALAKLSGSTTNLNSVTFKNQPRLVVQLDPYSTTMFADDAGAVFDLVPSKVPTRVTAQGTSMALTGTEPGGGTTVITRNFFVHVVTGEAWLSLTLWEQSGELRKQWIIQPASETARLRFAVGDLSPGRTYAVLRNGQMQASVTADAAGAINFADAPGTTGAVDYAITPTQQLPTKPLLSVIATDPLSAESGRDRGRFAIRRVGNINSDLIVKYSIGGTALNGADYIVLPGTVSIPLDDDSATVVVRPIDDPLLEAPETVLLALTPDPAYDILVESATVDLLDNDSIVRGLPVTVAAAQILPTAGQTNRLLSLNWNAVTGLRYRLQFNSGLNSAGWTNLNSSVIATNDSVTEIDVLDSMPQRFYRVLVLP